MRAHLKAQSRNGSSDQNARWNEKVRSGQRSAALSGLRLEQRTAVVTTKNRRSAHQSLNGLAKPVLKKKFSGRVMQPPARPAKNSLPLVQGPHRVAAPTISRRAAGPHT